MHPLMLLYQRLILTGLAVNCSPIINAFLHDYSVSHRAAINCHFIETVNVCPISYQVPSFLLNLRDRFKAPRNQFRLLHSIMLCVYLLLNFYNSFDNRLLVFPYNSLSILCHFFGILELGWKKSLSTFIVLILMLVRNFQR